MTTAKLAHRAYYQSDFVAGTGQVSGDTVLLPSNLAQRGVNVGHQRRLRVTVTANVGESCNKPIATIRFFEQE